MSGIRLVLELPDGAVALSLDRLDDPDAVDVLEVGVLELADLDLGPVSLGAGFTKGSPRPVMLPGAMHSMPGFRRRQILGELRAYIEMREPLDEVLSWLRTTEARVVEAVEMVEQATGLLRGEVETAFTEHPDWRRLVQLMGGFDGELLNSSVPETAA